METQELAPIEAIKQLKARYFRLMDQKRWDEWVEVFTPDVHIDTSDDGGPDFVLDGRDVFRAKLQPMIATAVTTHHGHMPEITLTGPTTATGVWAMFDHVLWPDGGFGELIGSGWYEEEYRYTDGVGWQISTMVLRRNRVVLGGKQIIP
ncbi:MAG: nuclear transport factor 2 family protein [Acidimicrobiales bacterium]|nr:nuclear transport factor 2 family protein [Acidimicrobiales bacterium]